MGYLFRYPNITSLAVGGRLAVVAADVGLAVESTSMSLASPTLEYRVPRFWTAAVLCYIVDFCNQAIDVQLMK